jgi:hypothetical protein
MKNHRPAVRVRILKTAQNGTRWNIWDADPLSGNNQPYGHEPWNGFATKKVAQDWVRDQNANDFTRRYQIVIN